MLFRRLTILFAGLGLAASLALAAPTPAAAAPKITVTATGTIFEGTDNDGSLTGVAGQDLENLTASVVHVFTFTSGAEIDDTTVPGSIFAFFESVETTVTVGVNTVTFSSTEGSGFYNLIPSSGLDASTQVFDGSNEFLAGIFVFDDTFTFGSIFDEFSFTSDPGGWSFGAAAFDGSFENEESKWFFTAAPSSVTVRVERTAVPSPAALGLFLVGLAGLAAARRRG